MNRRSFLTGIIAAAAAPAIPALPAPIKLLAPFAPTENALQLEITNRIAEYWTRRLQSAFVLTMQECGMEP